MLGTFSSSVLFFSLPRLKLWTVKENPQQLSMPELLTAGRQEQQVAPSSGTDLISAPKALSPTVLIAPAVCRSCSTSYHRQGCRVSIAPRLPSIKAAGRTPNSFSGTPALSPALPCSAFNSWLFLGSVQLLR